VFSLAEENRHLDAYSFWRNDKPYVFLNTVKTAEHSRFDAAHELAHLTTHRHTGSSHRSAEDEANAFASAFLMPQADLIAVMPRVRSLNDLIEGKRRWRVSPRNHREIRPFTLQQACTLHISAEFWRIVKSEGLLLWGAEVSMRKFNVHAKWDSEARVWVAWSDDIPGLATEADTFEHLVERVTAVAPELLALNHETLDSGADLAFLAERHEHLADAA
jgi:predicted RNase H-like HicB family nuclease